MEKEECKKCGKVIEGFTHNHVAFMMIQHGFKHQRETERAREKKSGVKKK